MLEKKLDDIIQCYIDETKSILSVNSSVSQDTKDLIENVSKQVCYALNGFKNAIIEELNKN